MNPLAPYKLLIEVAVIGTLVAALAWGVHQFLQHEQEIGYQRAVSEYQAKLVQAQNEALAKQNAMQKQLEDAQNAAQQREQVIKTLSSSTSTAASGLRDTLSDIRNGVSGATAEALRRSVLALTTVSGDCTERYRTVAEDADRATSAVKTYQDAWPK